MDLRILLASFALVFVAELGDKTQLTALAFTASSRSPWTVFVGTSLALVATTALAVAFGEVLTRFISPRALQIASGVMFVLMGLLLLVNVARKAETEKPAPAPADKAQVGAVEMPGGGALFRLIVSQAAALEGEIIEDMEDITRSLPAGAARDTLEKIIREDRNHVRAIEAMPTRHAEEFDKEGTGLTAEEFSELRERGRRIPSRIRKVEEDATEIGRQEALARLLRREEALADAYFAFSRMSRIHAVKDAFRWLALEDIRHAHALCDLVNPPDMADAPGTAEGETV